MRDLLLVICWLLLTFVKKTLIHSIRVRAFHVRLFSYLNVASSPGQFHVYVVIMSEGVSVQHEYLGP